MKSPPFEIKRVLIHGTLLLFLAECLALPTGLLITVYLARKLGAQSFGLFTLTVVLVGWIEFSIAALFTRATIKFIGEAEDWKPIGTTAIKLYLFTSLVVTALFWILAPFISHLFREPVLADYLRLLAIDIPIFSLSRAYQNILIGRGRYGARAALSTTRWIIRCILILGFVQLGFSVPGAIFGSVGASLVELIAAYFLLRLPFSFRSGMPSRLFWRQSFPLFLSVVSLTLYKRLDLFMLKVLGGTAVLAGIYGVSQRLSILSEIFTASLTSLLISTVSRLLSRGDIPGARNISSSAIRALVWLLPFAGMGAAAAPEIMQWIFGSVYKTSAPLLSILLFGVLAWNMISVSTAILAAFGKPKWAFSLTGPLIPLAVLGHLLLIPKFGALGAAWVTTLLAISGMVFGLFVLSRLLKVYFPAAALCRSLPICLLAYFLTSIWPVLGYLLLLKLVVITIFMVCAFLLSGELTSKERSALREWFFQGFLWKKDPQEV